MKHLYLAAALALAYPAAHAQQTPPCPAGVITCNNSTQTMGDTIQTASADNDQSITSQAGGHSNSIASGVTISPKVQQSGNAVTQSGNKVSATGGNAVGNTSANNSAANANNAGMNGLGGTATVGPIANTAAGGAGGAGGSAKVGDVGSTSGAVVNGGATSMDASNHSKSSFVVMSDQPQVPMSFSPAANVAMTADGECEPMQEVIQTPVYGMFRGFWGNSSRVIDHYDTLAPPTLEALNSIWGARALYTTTVLNTSGARSISIGGFGSSGGGQGSIGASSSENTMVQHISMRVCRMPVARVQQEYVYIPATPAPPPVMHRIFHKRAVVNCPKP